MLGMWTSTNLKKENRHNSRWLTDDVHWIVKDRNWDSDYKVIPNISCLKSQVKSYKKSWSNLGKKLTKTITKTKQNKEEQIKSKEHIILKMLRRCLSAVISPTTNFMQTWITLQKSGKFFVLLQFKMIVWQWYTFIPYVRSPPPPHPSSSPKPDMCRVDKKQKGRKNKFYNFSLVHCQFIIKLLLWTISVPDEGCSQTTPKCTTDPCNFFFFF